MPQTLRVPPSVLLIALFAIFGVRGLWQVTLPEAQANAAPAAATASVAGDTAARADELAIALSERLAATREAASRDDARAFAEARAKRVWPAKGGLTGWWGEPRGGRSHAGIDIDGEIGDPIYSLAMGTVIHAGGAPVGYSGYGETVLIDHDGFVTLYAHLSRVDVVVGQHVPAGFTVGAMGVTGNVTGSHLHFEVRVDGRPVDPRPHLPTH